MRIMHAVSKPEAQYYVGKVGAHMESSIFL